MEDVEVEAKETPLHKKWREAVFQKSVWSAYAKELEKEKNREIKEIAMQESQAGRTEKRTKSAEPKSGKARRTGVAVPGTPAGATRSPGTPQCFQRPLGASVGTSSSSNMAMSPVYSKDVQTEALVAAIPNQ